MVELEAVEPAVGADEIGAGGLHRQHPPDPYLRRSGWRHQHMATRLPGLGKLCLTSPKALIWSIVPSGPLEFDAAVYMVFG